MRSVFFIPVWNEIAAFGKVLEELAATALPCDTILLVNNGSTDGSERLVHESGHPYIDIPRNRGVGYSYLRAVEWAVENGYDVIGTMASNGKMLASEMARVLGPVLEDRADYVTGSRFLEGGASPNLPEFRRRAIPAVNQFVRVITGRKLTDATCGYRAWRLEIIRRARFDWHAEWLYTYGFEYYLYAKVLLAKQYRSIEVPVTMRYPDKGRPYSKIRGARDWYAMLKPFVAARLDGKGFA